MSLKCLHILIGLALALNATQIHFTDGVIGKALADRYNLPQNALLPPQGTVMCWIRLDEDPKLAAGMLLSLGQNRHGWSYARWEKGTLILDCKEFFAVKTSNLDLKEKTWHHLAWTWGTHNHRGFLSIFLDGKLKRQTDIRQFPDQFPSGDRGLLYNTAWYTEPRLKAAIDEMALFHIALDQKAILDKRQKGREKRPLTPTPGCSFLAHFDGSLTFSRGPEPDPVMAMKMKRRASRKAKLQTYDDELTFDYSLSLPLRDTAQGRLQDGDDQTFLAWRGNNLEVTCDLTQTCQIRMVEIIACKHTNAYKLEKLTLTLDDGSGVFDLPRTMTAYARPSKAGEPIADSSCKDYAYRFMAPGRACRLTIQARGKAYMSLSEIRICGTAPSPEAPHP